MVGTAKPVPKNQNTKVSIGFVRLKVGKTARPLPSVFLARKGLRTLSPAFFELRTGFLSDINTKNFKYTAQVVVIVIVDLNSTFNFFSVGERFG